MCDSEIWIYDSLPFLSQKILKKFILIAELYRHVEMPIFVYR